MRKFNEAQRTDGLKHLDLMNYAEPVKTPHAYKRNSLSPRAARILNAQAFTNNYPQTSRKSTRGRSPLAQIPKRLPALKHSTQPLAHPELQHLYKRFAKFYAC